MSDPARQARSHSPEHDHDSVLAYMADDHEDQQQPVPPLSSSPLAAPSITPAASYAPQARAADRPQPTRASTVSSPQDLAPAVDQNRTPAKLTHARSEDLNHSGSMYPSNSMDRSAFQSPGYPAASSASSSTQALTASARPSMSASRATRKGSDDASGSDDHSYISANDADVGDSTTGTSVAHTSTTNTSSAGTALSATA